MKGKSGGEQKSVKQVSVFQLEKRVAEKAVFPTHLSAVLHIFSATESVY